MLASNTWMFIHNKKSTFWMQGAGDFLVVVHAVWDPSVQSEVVRFEKITESRNGRASRQSGLVKAYDPAEKEEIAAGRGRFGLEVGHG